MAAEKKEPKDKSHAVLKKLIGFTPIEESWQTMDTDTKINTILKALAEMHGMYIEPE